jgi:SAM-dependent methyltransferase
MKLTERANAGLHEHVIEQAIAATPNRSASVLDVGCGTGALLVRLRDHGYTQLIGIDISPPEAMPGLRFHALDLDEPRFPIADQSVDLILAVEVVEHIENVGLFLAEIHRVMTPSGRLLLTTPNVHSVEAKVRLLLTGQLKQFDGIGDPTHIYPVFGFAFSRLLTRHALRASRSWGFPEDGASPTSRLALRILAAVARLLGVRGDPDGDQLCLLIQRTNGPDSDLRTGKGAALTSHY